MAKVPRESEIGKNTCPQCSSEEIAPIVYGLPRPELMQRAALGEVLLGGCIVFDGAPDYCCLSCGHKWLQGTVLG